MNMSQHSALQASGILGCIRRGIMEKQRTVILALSLALMRPCLEY